MSVPFFGLMIVWMGEQIFRWKIFSQCDWNAAWAFGAVASLVLYPSALGLTRVDAYSWGWASQAFVVIVALITLFLLWRKNKFGVVLLFALLTLALHFQGSSNLWDDLIDPIYGAMAIGVFLKKVLTRFNFLDSDSQP